MVNGSAFSELVDLELEVARLKGGQVLWTLLDQLVAKRRCTVDPSGWYSVFNKFLSSHHHHEFRSIFMVSMEYVIKIIIFHFIFLIEAFIREYCAGPACGWIVRRKYHAFSAHDMSLVSCLKLLKYI